MMLSISCLCDVRRLPRVSLWILFGSIALTGCNAVKYGLVAVVSGGVEAEQVIGLPPLDLPANSHHFDAPQPVPLHASFHATGWMHGFTLEIRDAAGDTVPSSVLHHIKILMPERRELFMPIALRLVGAGAETRAARVPRTMGIPFQAGDSLVVTAMVHNPTGRDLTGVSVRVRLHYTTAPARPRPDAVYPFFLHAAAPDAQSDFDLPPGYSERSWEARPATAGRILALGGHLHRYGTTLRLEDLTTGREIWRTTPQVDSAGNVLDIRRKIYRLGRGPRLDPEHTYRVTAAYYNPTGATIAGGGMGTVGGVFRPDDAWPGRNVSDPLYVMDLQREGGGHHTAPAHSHHD